MLRPFLWHDTIYFIRQRDRFVPLSMAVHVINAPSPLWLAWNEKAPWQVPKSFTYHWQRERQHGFLQMLCRSQQAQADILYLSPPPTSEEEVRLLWPKKLNLIGQRSSQRGLQRIFVTVPSESDLVSLFLAAGFSRYGRESVLRRTSLPAWTEQLSDPWQIRPGYEIDRWQISRFVSQHVPATVRAAENKSDFSVPLAQIAARKGEEGQELLFKGDTLYGLISWRKGRAGSWLGLLLSPRASHLLEPLLASAVRRLPVSERKPVYVAVRHYQQELLAPLQRLGFTSLLEQDQMVKYLAQPVKEEALATQVALAGQPIVPANSTLWPEGGALYVKMETGGQREPVSPVVP